MNSGLIFCLNRHETNFNLRKIFVHLQSADDVARREVFDQMLDRLLGELQPVCLAEQNFCMKFFRLGGPGAGPVIPNSVSQVRHDPLDHHFPCQYFFLGFNRGRIFFF